MREALVTGGAGYIGSHLVRQLQSAGYGVVVYDNLSTGYAESIGNATLVQGDTRDERALNRLFDTHRFDAVFHLAARLIVPESVARPLEYYANNTLGTLVLLQCCRDYGVSQFVFSSTAAVYGEPVTNPVSEATPPAPINPYGRSKRMSEQMIEDFAATSALRYVILRYFNVAGADPAGRNGQRLPGATSLIQVACDAALGRRDAVTIYGTNFDTPDGTGIRDYIHVEDLAAAHLHALPYLESGGASVVLNCGYGSGYSVRAVVETTQRLSGVVFPVIEGPRRAGDPACVISDSRAIRACLDWKPRYADLDTIVGTTLAWERQRKAALFTAPKFAVK